MQLGTIGLGRMGGNMAKRLEERGHDVKTYDPGVASTAVFVDLAPDDGYAHVEYGLMQAYAEGFEVMKCRGSGSTCTRSRASGGTDRSSARGCWNCCCLPRSRRRAHSRGYVEDSGEGRWTIAEAIAEDVPVPVITAALFARFASRQDESFAAKVNAALRNQFGGHAVEAAEQEK